ncbi:hypothetical protein ACEWY4_014249 [Coilia grayii]|uniref:Helically-extended SH3 domain-containing protein n=1 Tax=Coilia grayii TaxID=363190 RepID=A0ABD1JRR3_9TELE
MNKPAIPQKPKIIPPPPNGNRASLISAINAAVENKMAITPRVVFKDDNKRSTSKPSSPQSPSPPKETSVKLDFTDKNQKKEADLFKQAMKDRKLPMVLPVPAPTPAPEPEPEPASPPKPELPTKPPTPKKKGISFFKKPSKPPKVKAETVSPPNLPSPPSNGTAPVVAQKPLLPPIPVTAPAPDSPVADTAIPTASTPVAKKPLVPPIPDVTTPPCIPEPVIPEAAVSFPDVSSLDVTALDISPPIIPEPEALTTDEAANPIPDPEVSTAPVSTELESPVPEIAAAIPDVDIPNPEIAVEDIPEQDVPIPDVPTLIALEVPEVPEYEISVSDIPAPEMSVPDDGMSDVLEFSDIPPPVIPPPEIPDTDTPDPVISDPAIPDPDIQDVDITTPSISGKTSLDPLARIIPAPSIPATDSLAVSRTPSPEQVTLPDPNPSLLPSELPPAPVEFAGEEDAISEPKQDRDSGALTEEVVEEPPKPMTTLSALERAKEASPEKRTQPGDHRILTLLEKAKRKYAAHQANKAPAPSTPPSVSPVPPDPPVCVTPTPADPTPSVSPTLLVLELPPVDYEEPVGEAAPVLVGDQGEQTTLLNGFDHRQVSPILEEPLMEEAQTEVLPARKPLPTVPSLGSAPEKPPRPPVVDLSPYQLNHVQEPQEENGEVIAASQDFAPDLQNVSAVVPEREDVLESGAADVEIPESYIMEEALASVEHGDLEDVLDGDYAETVLGAAVDEADSPTSHEARAASRQQESPPDNSDNIYEDVTTNKKKSKKRKAQPKNPYADTQPPPEETPKPAWFKAKKTSAEIAEEKEQKKREKQREKEREKEREREKKEQKEREKKENEMKKKFKITGQEEPMYAAKVTVASKGKNNDLPVKPGDIVSIIRTTNCPKGKWLARDDTNKYGYICVGSVELDIKDMLELGKKVSKKTSLTNSFVDGDTQNLDGGMSNHYELGTESFSDDDEWNDDDEHEPLSPTEITEITETTDNGLYSTLSMPETVSLEPESPEHTQCVTSTEDPHMQARHEALHKLAIFFKKPPSPEGTTGQTTPTPAEEPSTEASLTNSFPGEADLDVPDMLVLPPPDLYADVITEESLYTYSN